ncbi:sugar-binding domain-containing protein [Shinella sp.]|uniref:sugar-binding transcriptional regulator n=1 Tax=Shinella sp. TaxID=1870904 RepID=UPI002589200D|nr:sugar-binding domain-containing protein [Shinella sp.]MCW5706902.1 hypothetical protein [Shinella sp.]
MSNPRDELLAQVAYWYYVDGDGLGQIAKRIGRSVSMVSRMLSEAREQELVDIRINFPLNTASTLERKIEQVFQIRQAHVFAELDAKAGIESLARFGQLGADATHGHFESAQTVAVSWGSQVHAIVKSLRPVSSSTGGEVIQTSGAIGATSPEHDGARICQKLADKLGFQATFLHSPLVVDTKLIADALRSSPTIENVLQRARKADVVLASVGSPFGTNPALVRLGYLKPDDVESMRAAGSVGDIMGYAMDPEGRILDIGLNDRLVSLHPKDLFQISTVIVAAIGRDKVPAIRAALRAGYVNILVTDKITAEGLLETQ